jgi:integrase
MPKARTGQLIQRKAGWYARVWTIVDGERVRVCRALGTQNKLVAKRKLARLLEAENATSEDAKRPETFAEAAERVYGMRRTDGVPRVDEEIVQVRTYAFPIIGPKAAALVEPTDINQVLDACKASGKSRATVQHLRQRVSNVFAQLKREGAIKHSPVADASMPTFQKVTIKERAVLTDSELAIYLSWENPDEQWSAASLERQVMACMSRMFGGLRTGDLHALRWDAFDVDQGAFVWGYAPRQKTRQPQLLEVPELLRPYLKDWWERAGRPSTGLIFPARRAGKRGDRTGQERIKVSHASRFRRDLKRAFKDATERRVVGVPTPGSRRWRELFDGTDYTLPVDFHSWRRAYAQALATADVSAQQAMALTGHSDMSVHARYLRNAGKMRKLPDAALPQITIVEKALAMGSDPETDHLSEYQAAPNEPETAEIFLAAANGSALAVRRSAVRSRLAPLDEPRIEVRWLDADNAVGSLYQQDLVPSRHPGAFRPTTASDAAALVAEFKRAAQLGG